MKNSSTLLLLALLLISTSLFSQSDIQYSRPWNKEGINIFEPVKSSDQPAYEGFKLRIGGSFTQDYQHLKHSNTPTKSANYLYGVVKAEDSTSALLRGFNLAMANLNFDFQIEDGIMVRLENYMSSRHHSEFWVKGGYVQIDKLPMFGNPQWFTDNFRVKIGHFVPNFGDMHFRRTDGGNAMFNPFVENLIFDAFTTEIGAEVYAWPTKSIMAMVGMTSGYINGNVDYFPTSNNSSGVVPTKKTPSIFAKLAYDNNFEDLRFRLSASVYTNPNISRNTLYAGDRTGSHYFLAMEPALTNGAATTMAAQFTSGRLNPDMANRITAFMINPFLKYKGLEVTGSYETLSGSVYGDVKEGKWVKRNSSQYSVEASYRFLANESMYIGVRQIGAKAELRGITSDVNINRFAVAAGWFPTKNLLLKAEIVSQKYKDFPSTDYRYNGKFNGAVIEAVVGF
ncbi:MAG TPA: hypothetical protein PKM27_05910 [Saprospiraceae bacterium]|nr:hypothetical protein [Saprospiraceae bacterium]HNT19578.1 hypothetical protein [Saprospiraceae bacterium]